MSRSPAQRVYPYSMDNGIPLNCKWYGGIQSCSTSERWPGLYEVREAARVRADCKGLWCSRWLWNPQLLPLHRRALGGAAT